jgi:hypothetical protein
MSVSDSSLCYLFADLLVGKMTAWERLNGFPGMETPSSGEVVHFGRFEQEMLAVALWHLHLAGSATISEVEPDKESGVRRSHRRTLRLRIVRLGNGQGLAGLEAALFECLPEEGTANILDVIGELYEGRRGGLPVNGLLAIVQHEAVGLGILTRTERSGRLPRSLAWTRTLPAFAFNDDLLEDTEGLFNEMDQRLSERIESEEDLWNRLLDECGTALFFARPVPDHPQPG